MSTLGSQRILQLHSLHVPPSGGWLADVSLDSTALPPLGAATLTIADLQLVGTVTQAGYDDHPTGGARPRVTIEGGPGWRTVLPLASYQAPGGVRLSTVLRDLAGYCGEPYDAPADVLLPPTYGWADASTGIAITGRGALADLVQRGAVPTWRVAASGRTRFDAWPATGAADGVVRVTKRNLARGRRTVALDTRLAALLPGSTLEGVAVARLLAYETAGKLHAEVYSV